jgi:hypothetical protein
VRASALAQQPVNLRVVRKQLGERTSQPDCLRRHLVAAAVALVEDQVNDRKNGVETLAEQVNRWHSKRDPRSFDLRLARTSRCAIVRSGTRKARAISSVVSPPRVPQGERNLRLDCERRVTAGEDELQALVGKRRGLHRHLSTIACDEQAELGREGPVAADAVRRVIASRRHQPGARVAGDAVAWPPVGGDGERLLRRSGWQGCGPILAEDLFERRYQYTSEGRISTAPP